LSEIERTAEMRALIRLLAARSGQLLERRSSSGVGFRCVTG
jgi:hypothetical protein